MNIGQKEVEQHETVINPSILILFPFLPEL